MHILPRFLRNWLGLTPPAGDVVSAFMSEINSRPPAEAEQIRAALMVRAMNDAHTSMTGRQFSDVLMGADPTQPLAAYVYPFPQITGGASDVVIAADEQGEPYVLLARKHDENAWGLPAGYMQPAAPFNPQGLQVENTENRDVYDRSMMATGAPPVAGAAINRFVPVPQTPTHDKTLKDTAHRELLEETGLNLDNVDPDYISSHMNYVKLKSALGPQPVQQQDQNYLFDIRDKKSLPAIKPGDDIAEVQWVKLSAITPDGLAGNMSITPEYNKILQLGLAHMREKEINAFGVTADQVTAYSTLPKPASELGPEAMAWHTNALTIAKTMQETLKQHMARQESSQGAPNL